MEMETLIALVCVISTNEIPVSLILSRYLREISESLTMGPSMHYYSTSVILCISSVMV